ncbi:MAG: hypothetical protein H6713_03020 [Myxococcales bacterium]|nr:hypothetical protein [Myxococcales bacterium]MCB9748960.1 hypothetical protein [Myxococcales bacterium]
MQTWLLLGLVLAVGVVVANFAISNPDVAKNGMDAFMGLPSWAFPTIAGVAGLVVYLLGLRVATNWPEAVGALLVSGAVVFAEILFGWNNFAVGGVAAIPYVLPIVVFLGMLLFAVTRSR